MESTQTGKPYIKQQISDQSKLTAFGDDKIKVTQNLKFFFGWIENIAEKGENAGYQHFLLFPQCFQKPFFAGFKVGMVWQGVKGNERIRPRKLKINKQKVRARSDYRNRLTLLSTKLIHGEETQDKGNKISVFSNSMETVWKTF